MKHRAIELTAALLGLLALAAAGIILFYVAGLASIAWLLCAALALLGGYVTALSILLVTNTRRPWGVNPNLPAPPARQNRERADPFGATTDELRVKVNLQDGQPYGARRSDDTSVVRRLAAHFEQEDAGRPVPSGAPAWALDLMQNHGDVDTGLEIPARDEEETS